MKFLGNIIWLLFGGIITSVEYLISSLILMITIIGIPFGLQTLKLAILALWPFGSRVVDEGNSGGCLSLIMNVIWIFVGGFWICLTHLGFLSTAMDWGFDTIRPFAMYHDHRHPFRHATF